MVRGKLGFKGIINVVNSAKEKNPYIYSMAKKIGMGNIPYFGRNSNEVMNYWVYYILEGGGGPCMMVKND